MVGSNALRTESRLAGTPIHATQIVIVPPSFDLDDGPLPIPPPSKVRPEFTPSPCCHHFHYRSLRVSPSCLATDILGPWTSPLVIHITAWLAHRLSRQIRPRWGTCHSSWLQPRIKSDSCKAFLSCCIGAPCFIGCSFQKVKDCAQAICIRDAGCLVITSGFPLVHSFILSVSHSTSCNGYLWCFDLSFLFASSVVLLTSWLNPYV